MTDRLFTDEELVAFIDGEGDYAPLDDIRKALQSDVALQKRLEALAFDSDVIASGFQHIKPKAGDRVVLPPSQKPSFAMSNIAAAVLVALLCGGMAGWSLSNKNTSPNNWVDYVAAYQALYINATLSEVSASDETKRNELSRAASAIGKNIPLDALQLTGQADFKRAQILGFEGKPLVQLAFLSRTGAPIALCIFRNGDDDTDMTAQNLEGMQSASWSRDGYGYLLIGSEDAQLINEMASYFIEQKI